MNVRSWLLILAVVLTGTLVACGDDDDSENIGNGESPTAAAEDHATETGEATEVVSTSSGELRIAGSFVPATLQPLEDGYSIVQFGLAETLTRISADQQVEPWLAESITSEDDTVWTITLRDNATFWNGDPVDAAAVVASLAWSLENIPSAPQYLDAAVELEAIDERTVELRLPEATPALPNNLATFHLLITVPDESAFSGYQYTGPYQPVDHTPDTEMRLEAYPDHWAGPPPFAAVEVKLVRDANARMLALQSGEVDLVNQVPAELASNPGAGIEVVTTPSTRVHYIILNHQTPPFNDPAVREAFSIAIDRDILNEIALSGRGTPTWGPFAEGLGLPTIDPLTLDLERAASVLDEAGWTVGDNGVREKDGEPLELTLLTYASRPELPVIAVSIQDQLGQLGFDITIEQSEDIVASLSDPAFDAGMFSVNLVPIGDPRYAFNVTLIDVAIYNYGGYSNARLNEIMTELQTERDESAREALIIEAQEIVAADFANTYLISAPRIVAYRTDAVAPFTLHPNDLYQIDETLRPASSGS